MARQREQAGKAVPNHKVLGVTFADGTGRTMEDAVAIKNYNGSLSSGKPDPDTEPETKAFFYTNRIAQGGYYCYWNIANQRWELSRYGSENKNYVLTICGEVE